MQNRYFEELYANVSNKAENERKEIKTQIFIEFLQFQKNLCLRIPLNIYTHIHT